MSSIQKIKKFRTKTAQGRPVGTSQISQSVVEDLTSFSAFSPDGSLFAFLSLAVDKHRLRVYNTVSCQAVAEYTINSGRVTTLSWILLTLFSSDTLLQDPSAQPSQNKKRRRDSRAPVEEENFASPKAAPFIILGLSDGTLTFYSPALGQIVRRLSNVLSTASILSVASISTANESSIWTSSADATLRLWSIENNDVLYSYKSDDGIPYTSISIRPGAVEEPDMLVAHHGILLLSGAIDKDSNTKPKQLSSFTGHTSSVNRTQWIHSKSPPKRFLSMAEADRFLYIWDFKDKIQGGGPAASIPLDSNARTFAISTMNESDEQILVALSTSGKISLFPIPSELSPPASNSRTHHKIPTLLPRCNIHSSSAKSSAAQVIGVSFASEEQGILRVARLIKGIQLVFNVVHYLDDSGAFIPDVTLEGVEVAEDLNLHPYIPRNRYKESSTTVIGSGIGVGQHAEGESSLQGVEGDLEVDLAELSLGQRLTAVTHTDIQHLSETDDENQLSSKTKSLKKRAQQEVTVVPANSLTRTIIQALHSSDTRLLETCLAHSDSGLIYNTVKRLPPQLAIPLVTACVERLGRGARASNAKGGGGGASSQRGAGLITWIKAVLTVHAGHLMTIPDLVFRLSGLHSTLTSRLALHESLLSLSGRLEMVITQIEMRSSVAPAPITPRKSRITAHDQTKQVKRYVEGESESSDDDDHMEVEIESADGEGSIEDIELGGDTSEEEDASEKEGANEEDGDEEDDDFDIEDGSTMNGFIDDEAEEDSEEDDSD